MKKIPLLLKILMVILWLGSVSRASAEKIYCKDGKLINGPIIYRSDKALWVKYGAGSVGVDLKSIEKIENDNGSISKHDYKSQCSLLQDFIQQKNYSEAIELCAALLLSYPDNTQIRYLRGLLNQKIGDLPKASEDYDFLVKNKAADADILNNLGIIHIKNNDPQRAKELFAEAVRINPAIAEAHNNLAELFMQGKDYAGAIEEYRRVVEIEPDNTGTMYNLGIAYLKSADYPRAKEQFARIIAISPQDKDAKNALEYLKANNLGL